MHSRRFVAAIVLTVLACLAGADTSARALGSTSGTVQLTAASRPDVLRGAAGAQPGGELRFDSTDGSGLRVVNGEHIIVEVSDGLNKNCDVAGKSIGFHATPSVSVTSSNATISPALASSTATNALRASAPGCAAFVPTTMDQVILTVTAPIGGGTIGTINITGISYDVGALAAVGPLHINWASDVPPTDPTVPPAGTGDTATTVGPANGYITNLQVSSNRSGEIPFGTGRPFGTITFSEMSADATTPAAAGNGVCVNLRAPFHMVFVNAGAVAVTTGTDTTGAPALLNSGHTVRFGVTSTATKSTFVLSGEVVDVSRVGPQASDVTQCDATGAPLATTPSGESNSVTVYTTTIGPPAANQENTSVRFPGANRHDTAAQIAVGTFGCIAGDPVYTIVARDDDFADALAANYVAGQLGAPILLVKPTGPLPNETVNALHDLATTNVIVMGGPVAVGADVVNALAARPSFDCTGAERKTLLLLARPLAVTRIQGANRFATASAAASSTNNGHTIGTLDSDTSDGQAATLKTAILVNGQNFPDAVVAGPMAYQGSTCQRGVAGTNCDGFPLLESNDQDTTLPAETDKFLNDNAIKQVIVVGGLAAVPQEISDVLAAKGIREIRLAGATRRETATAVATFEYQNLQFGIVNPSGNPVPVGTVALARGDDFPDALSLGPLAGSVFEPILLTTDPSTVGATTDGYLAVIGGLFTGHTGGFSVNLIHVAGGTSAISDAAATEARSALG